MMKNFDDMTEEEILQEALGAVSAYLEQIRYSGHFDLEECVGLELGRIAQLYKQRRSKAPDADAIHQLFNWQVRKEEEASLDALLAYFKGILTERTIPIRNRYIRSRKASEINAISAKAVITSRLKEAGFDGYVSGQRYRARVEVPVGKRNRLRFYINYKDLHKEGLLEKVIEAVGRMRETLETLGPGAVVE